MKLRFARGRVTEIAASSGREAVDAEMARAGDAGRAFREFALGLNPALAVPDRNPWIPYYSDNASSSTLPELVPSFSSGTPRFPISVSHRFVCGVPFENIT